MLVANPSNHQCFNYSSIYLAPLCIHQLIWLLPPSGAENHRIHYLRKVILNLLNIFLFIIYYMCVLHFKASCAAAWGNCVVLLQVHMTVKHTFILISPSFGQYVLLFVTLPQIILNRKMTLKSLTSKSIVGFASLLAKINVQDLN